MTTKKTALNNRYAAAANARVDPDKAIGSTAIRTKPFRVTLDLAPADYAELNRWLASSAVAIDPDDPRRVSLASALRAMIHATTADSVVTAVVLDVLRQERAA